MGYLLALGILLSSGAMIFEGQSQEINKQGAVKIMMANDMAMVHIHNPMNDMDNYSQDMQGIVNNAYKQASNYMP